MNQQQNSRDDYINHIRLRKRRLQREGTNGEQADCEAANTTLPQGCRNNDQTVNRPHASQPTSNQAGMQGSKRGQRPTRWHQHACRRPYPQRQQNTAEAGSDPRGHLWVTWGVYLWAGKPPLADIILSHPRDQT